MKTIYKVKRVSVDEDTNIEYEFCHSFYLEDVMSWSESISTRIKNRPLKELTVVEFADNSITIIEPYNSFNKVMEDFNSLKSHNLLKIKN